MWVRNQVEALFANEADSGVAAGEKVGVATMEAHIWFVIAGSVIGQLGGQRGGGDLGIPAGAHGRVGAVRHAAGEQAHAQQGEE